MDNKILIADDVKSWQLFHTKLIEQLYRGIFEIKAVSSGREALSSAEENIKAPYRLIITDLQMEQDFEPLTAGEWLIENVKLIPEYKQTEIIIISSMYNIEKIAAKHHTAFIKKSLLAHNEYLIKDTMENLLPFLKRKSI